MLFRQICKSFVHRQQIYYSTNDGSSGKIIKDLNYVNKALFGAVENKKNITNKNIPETQLCSLYENNESITTQNGIGSEMYWLLKHEKLSAKDKKVRSKKIKLKLNPPSISTFVEPTEKPSIPFVVESIDDMLVNGSTIKLTDLLKSFPAYGSSIITDPATIPNFNDVEHQEQKWNNKQLPSVSKILQATMPMAARKALQQWKISKIAELGENGFMELQKSHLMIGSNFHNAIQHFFHTKQEPIADPDDSTSPAVINLWSSLRKTLTEIDSQQPALIEARILHPILQYRGIVDCVAKFGNEMTVIEWKKSDRAKETLSATFDAPLQLCAYLGAINADPIYQNQNIGQVKSGLVIVAYTNGSPAHCYRLCEKDVRKYWSQWLKRLHEYWVRTVDGTLPEPI